LIPKLGALRLQSVTAIDLEQYYNTQRPALCEATLEQHHMILAGALEAARRARHVVANVAKDMNGKPKAKDDAGQEVQHHCWTADETEAFLNAAKQAGDQPAAFYAVALEMGMRKSELGGLQWKDIDLARGSVLVRQQLVMLSLRARKSLDRPARWIFGPLKGKNHARSVSHSKQSPCCASTRPIRPS
jgi:integrase